MRSSDIINIEKSPFWLKPWTHPARSWLSSKFSPHPAQLVEGLALHCLSATLAPRFFEHVQNFATHFTFTVTGPRSIAIAVYVHRRSNCGSAAFYTFPPCTLDKRGWSVVRWGLVLRGLIICTFADSDFCRSRTIGRLERRYTSSSRLARWTNRIGSINLLIATTLNDNNWYR